MDTRRAPASASQGRRPGTDRSTDVPMVLGVVLVVFSVIAFAIGLIVAKAALVFASIGSAVLAKVVLEVGRRMSSDDRRPSEPRDLGLAGPPEDRPPWKPSPLASLGMAARSAADEEPLRGSSSGDDRGWRFEELLDDDRSPPGPSMSSSFSPVLPPDNPPPAAGVGADPFAPSAAFRAVPAGEGPVARPAAASSGNGAHGAGDIGPSLDRFGEHLVESLNQLFEDYVGEALARVQHQVVSERRELNDVRTQLKALVKAGARREDMLQDIVESVRGELHDLRDQVEALAHTSGLGIDIDVQQEIVRLAEEIRALRKRVALGGKRSGSGLDPGQVQALADAVVAAVLDSVDVEPGPAR